MFCYQCQETAKNEGCTVKGMCGKPEETANLHCKGMGNGQLIFYYRKKGRQDIPAGGIEKPQAPED